MNRLRSFAHEYLLPLVISALVLRALIPVGFMPGGGAGMGLTATLCNAAATGNPVTEVIEIDPGGDAGLAGMHCDFCVVPVLAGTATLPAGGIPAATDTSPALTPEICFAARFALARAQTPRAPPLA